MQRSSSLRCDDCPVRDTAVCSALSTDERAALARIGRTREFARGETIFDADDDVACATLIEGAIKLSDFDAEGVERIVALVHPAGFLGQLFAIGSGHAAVALAPSRLCLFPRRGFEEAVARHPGLARAILERSLREIEDLRRLVALIGRRDARARVAGLVLGFARSAGEAPCRSAERFDLPLTRGEMAGLLGLTIETVSRQLSAMEEEGLIRREGARGLILNDPAALETLVS